MSITTLGYGREIFRADHDAHSDTTRHFFQRNIEPHVAAWEKNGLFPPELFREAGRLGLLCAAIPEEYGGAGGDILHHIVLHEEHGYSVAGASLEAGLTTDVTATIIYEGGTDAQRQEWLPSFASGDTIAEVGLSEPGAGSDAKAITTFARRDGDDYVIRGQKAWVSNGPILSLLLLVARLPDEGDRSRTGLFLLPMDLTGVSRTKPTDLMMKSCGGTCEVFLDDVRVPMRLLLGEREGLGLRHALAGIDLGRVAAAVRAVAACELALSLSVEYTKDRKAFGQTIFDFQNTQFKLATLATEIAAARAFADAVLSKMLAKTVTALDTAKLKLFCTELEGRVMDECLQLHGAAGYSNEYPISKMYAFARIHRIYIGTSEILRSIIGRAL